MSDFLVLDRSIARSRAAGTEALDQALLAVPTRRSVWEQLSADDQDVLAIWLGLSYWPWTRRDRRRQAQAALDLDAETVRRVLHERPDVPSPIGDATPPGPLF